MLNGARNIYLSDPERCAVSVVWGSQLWLRTCFERVQPAQAGPFDLAAVTRLMISILRRFALLFDVGDLGYFHRSGDSRQLQEPYLQPGNVELIPGQTVPR